MSWLFSQALEAAYSGGTCSDGQPSAQLSVICTPHPFWHRDKTTDASRLSRFGLTWKPSTAEHGVALLTWFREAIRVRRTAMRAATARLLSLLVASSSELCEKFSLYSSCGKTRTPCEPMLPGLGGSSEMLWAKLGIAPSFSKQGPAVWEVISPKCGHTSLPFRAPNARDWKGMSAASWRKRSKGDKTPTLPDQIGGTPHPEFAEQLMGWPIGWTALEPLAMDKFRQWQRQHGGFCHE